MNNRKLKALREIEKTQRESEIEKAEAEINEYLSNFPKVDHASIIEIMHDNLLAGKSIYYELPDKEQFLNLRKAYGNQWSKARRSRLGKLVS